MESREHLMNEYLECKTTEETSDKLKPLERAAKKNQLEEAATTAKHLYYVDFKLTKSGNLRKALEKVEQLALNLYRTPWKRELYTLKEYGALIQNYLKPVLSNYEDLLKVLGYEKQGHFYVLNIQKEMEKENFLGNVKDYFKEIFKDKILKVAIDLYILQAREPPKEVVEFSVKSSKISQEDDLYGKGKGTDSRPNTDYNSASSNRRQEDNLYREGKGTDSRPNTDYNSASSNRRQEDNLYGKSKGTDSRPNTDYNSSPSNIRQEKNLYGKGKDADDHIFYSTSRSDGNVSKVSKFNDEKKEMSGNLQNESKLLKREYDIITKDNFNVNKNIENVINHDQNMPQNHHFNNDDVTRLKTSKKENKSHKESDIQSSQPGDMQNIQQINTQLLQKDPLKTLSNENLHNPNNPSKGTEPLPPKLDNQIEKTQCHNNDDKMNDYAVKKVLDKIGKQGSVEDNLNKVDRKLGSEKRIHGEDSRMKHWQRDNEKISSSKTETKSFTKTESLDKKQINNRPTRVSTLQVDLKKGNTVERKKGNSSFFNDEPGGGSPLQKGTFSPLTRSQVEEKSPSDYTNNRKVYRTAPTVGGSSGCIPVGVEPHKESSESRTKKDYPARTRRTESNNSRTDNQRLNECPHCRNPGYQYECTVCCNVMAICDSCVRKKIFKCPKGNSANCYHSLEKLGSWV